MVGSTVFLERGKGVVGNNLVRREGLRKEGMEP